MFFRYLFHNSPVPAKQHKLRVACALGDLRTVKKLLSSEPSSWWNWLWSCIFCVEEEPASLQYIYIDDGAKQPIHYIASGQRPHAHPEVHQDFGVPDTTAPSSHDAQRAALMMWLFKEHGDDVNLIASDSKAQTPLHWAVLTHSSDVLCEMLAGAAAISVAAAVEQTNKWGHSALDIALASQQWRAVQLLIHAGALQGCEGLRSAERRVSELLPQPPAAERPPADVVDDQPQGGGGLEVLGVNLFKLFSNFTKPLLLPPTPTSPLAADASSSVKPRVMNSSQEVAEHWQAAIAHVAFICGVEVSTAAALMAQHNYNTDAAIKAFMQDASCLQTEPAPKTSFTEGVTPTASRPDALQCIVCYEPATQRSIKLPCCHVTCDACWRGIFRACLDEGSTATAKCPEQGCCMVPPLAETQKLLSKTEWQRFLQLATQRYVDSNPTVKWCPRAGCGRSLTLDNSHGDAYVGASALQALMHGYGLEVQCMCGHEFCWVCQEEPHDPASCGMVRKWEEMRREHEQNPSETWLQSATKPCPGCGARIERTEGCNHMICSICRQHFCWACGESWDLHGPSTGGYYWCARATANPIARSSSGVWSTTGLFGLIMQAVQTVRSAAVEWMQQPSYYLNMYAANNQDVEELKRIVRHTQLLLALGLPHADSGLPLLHTSSAHNSANMSGSSKGSMSGSAGGAADNPGAADKGGLSRRSSLTEAVIKTLRQDSKAVVERLSYFQQILAVIKRGRQTLRHSYVHAYYMERGGPRRYLEHLTGRLLAVVEQLQQVVMEMPHRAAVPRIVTPDAEAQPTSSSFSFVQRVFLSGRKLFQVASAVFRHSRGAGWINLPGHELRDQFYYAVALHLRKPVLASLMSDINGLRNDIVQVARSGVLV